MGEVVKRLAPGVGAILLAAGVLLFSDLRSRRAPAEPVTRIALLQHASQKMLDEEYSGVLAGLAEAGYVEGQNLRIQRFIAEGDLATANAMAREIVSGNYDLAITLTTPSLQALAGVNARGQIRHVFGGVTDPTATGVGIGRVPLEHPAHLAGIGTMQPVAETMQLARKLYPKLKTLGVVWNPGEVNSEINTRLARKECRSLGIELYEANADNTSGVREAASSLIARGVEALWVGGDVTVLAALDAVVGPAHDARLPVFTSIPGCVQQGTLFDLGANYYEVGQQTGAIAARVLGGESPASIPVEQFVPTQLDVNVLATRHLKNNWQVPEDIRASADLLIDDSGTHDRRSHKAATQATTPRRLAVKKTVRIIEYINVSDVEDAERGVLDGIRAAGLIADEDFDYTVLNAQGDMAALNGLVDAAVTARADLIITLSTPTLQAAIRGARSTPIVFTFLADPIAAGASKSDTEHLPNVTGSYAAGDVTGLVLAIQKIMPAAKRIGVMYSPSEINSVYNSDLFIATAKEAGFEVERVGVNTASEVADAALALCSQPIDLVCLPTANLTASSFPSVVQATNRAKLPVFGFLGGMADQGAAVCVARDYYDMGHDAGGLAARVLRGEAPAKIPLQSMKTSKLILNLEAARKCRLEFSEELRKSAARIVGE